MPHSNIVRSRERDYRRSADAERVSSEHVPRGRGYRVVPPPGFGRRICPSAISLVDLCEMPLERSPRLPYVRVTNRKGAPVQEIYMRWADELLSSMPERRFRSTDGLYSVPNNCLIRADKTEVIHVRDVALPCEEPVSVVLPRAKKGRKVKRPKADRRTSDEIIARLNTQYRETRDQLKHWKQGAAEASAQNVKRAAPILRSILKERELGRDEGRFFAQDIARAIADLEGDKAVRFFKKLANNESRPYYVRRAGLIGLGQICSAKSAAAYGHLRDKARAVSGAPQEKDAYTHAERIWEAMEMTDGFILGSPGSSGGRLPSSALRARLSPDFQSASVYSRGRSVELKRFGDEWMVVEIGAVTMP